jgi:hypothetical protein
VEGGLWAWEVLQHALKVAAKDAHVFKVWMQVKVWEIGSSKPGDFILCDGPIHGLLSVAREDESCTAWVQTDGNLT